MVRIDTVIDLDARDLAEIRTQRRRQLRSARWTGWIKPLVAGDYAFAFKGGHARVIVGREVVAGAGAPSEARIAMGTDRFYPVTIEVTGLNERTSLMQLEWRPPYGGQRVVPQVNLFLPTDGAKS